MRNDERAPRSDTLRNRQRLVESARAVFAEYGVGAPLDEIAKRAGLGSATLYRHFATREALILETLRVDLRRHMKVIERACLDVSPWAGFEQWITFCFQDQLTDAGLSQRLLVVAPGTDEEVDRLRRQTLDGIDSLIVGAKREGTFRRDRWLADVVLHLHSHDLLVRPHHAAAAVASARWLELTLSTFSTKPPRDDDVVPQSVIAVEAAYAHRLAGEPLTDDDL
jgi:AcrR family transcriptional regulator